MKKFSIYKKEGKQIIERLVYPRFIADITFSPKDPNDITITEWIDTPITDAGKLARTKHSVFEYILKGHQIK